MPDTVFVLDKACLSKLPPAARFTKSENSVSRSPGPAGPVGFHPSKALLWGLKMEEKQKHRPPASACSRAEAQTAGCRWSSARGFQEGVSPPGCQLGAIFPTIPVFPDFLIFAFPASNSLSEPFSKYLMAFVFLSKH